MSRILSYFIVVIVAALITFGVFLNKASAGFVGPDQSTQYNTVKDILDHPVDDVKVHLKGKITAKIAWNRYIFKDDTGEITVKIKPSKISHVDITPKTKIEIFGEIEVKYVVGGAIEVEVDHIAVVSDAVKVPTANTSPHDDYNTRHDNYKNGYQFSKTNT